MLFKKLFFADKEDCAAGKYDSCQGDLHLTLIRSSNIVNFMQIL